VHTVTRDTGVNLSVSPANAVGLASTAKNQSDVLGWSPTPNNARLPWSTPGRYRSTDPLQVHTVSPPGPYCYASPKTATWSPGSRLFVTSNRADLLVGYRSGAPATGVCYDQSPVCPSRWTSTGSLRRSNFCNSPAI